MPRPARRSRRPLRPTPGPGRETGGLPASRRPIRTPSHRTGRRATIATIGQPLAAAINILTASSRHPGGVNVAFADGSVHFLKSSVSPQAWYAIATEAGNEVLSSDSY